MLSNVVRYPLLMLDVNIGQFDSCDPSHLSFFLVVVEFEI